jgi:hypothetical protein
MLGMLKRFTLDPGISDQFTEISIIGIPNHLHRKINSTSKHHLHKVHVDVSVPVKRFRAKVQKASRVAKKEEKRLNQNSLDFMVPT